MARRQKPGVPGRLMPPDAVDALMVTLQEKERAKVEARPLKADAALVDALQRQPDVWIEGICQQHGIEEEEPDRRLERLAAILPTDACLRAAWRRLPRASREMARWILRDEGGAASLEDLAATFGPDEDVTWWWNERQVPRTPLGVLRLNGLVCVGTVRAGSARARTAVIPVDLRAPLEGIVDEEPAPEARAPAQTEPGEAPERAPAPPTQVLEAVGPSGAPPRDAAPRVEWVSLDEFVRRTPFDRASEASYADLLEKVAGSPKNFRPAPVRAMLARILGEGHEWARLAAYAVGVATFGASFAEPALRDPSAQVRAFARALAEARAPR